MEKMVLQAPLGNFLANVCEIGMVGAAKPAGNVQPALLCAWSLFEQAKRLGQNVQSFFGTNAGEITDRKRPLVFRTRSTVAGKVQARIDNVDARTGDGEIIGHEIGIVGASGHEAVNIAAMKADQGEAAAAVRFGQ